MDLRWEVDQLGSNLAAAFPDMGWNQSYRFSGMDPLDLASAAEVFEQLGDLDRLENLLRGATSPGALAEVDIDRARELLGDDSAESLERLSELAKLLEEAGLVEHREGRFELTPRGIRRIGQNALSDLFRRLAKDRLGGHEQVRVGRGHERVFETKGYEFGDPFNLHIERTIRNAIARTGPGHAGVAVTRRLRDRTDRADDSGQHRPHARPLAVDADARQLPGRQEGGHGVAVADLVAVPARLPRHRRVQLGRPRALAERASRGVVGLRVRHQHAARVPAQPADARPPARQQADHHDHRRRADGPLRARHERAVLRLPAGAGDGRRHACAR